MREADCGHAALELALAAAPEVALVDIGLPELDGFAVAGGCASSRRTRRSSRSPATAAPKDRRRASEAGFRAPLVKPVDIDELCALIDTLD